MLICTVGGVIQAWSIKAANSTKNSGKKEVFQCIKALGLGLGLAQKNQSGSFFKPDCLCTSSLRSKVEQLWFRAYPTSLLDPHTAPIVCGFKQVIMLNILLIMRPMSNLLVQTTKLKSCGGLYAWAHLTYIAIKTIGIYNEGSVTKAEIKNWGLKGI